MCITDDIEQIMMLGELMEACNSHIEPALLHLDRKHPAKLTESCSAYCLRLESESK